MSEEENKFLARRIVEDFINKNNQTIADELYADDFINHSPLLDTTPDKAGFKRMVALYHQGFKDFHVTIVGLTAENDRVVLHVLVTGTHTGEFMGKPPTNKRLSTYMITTLRFAEGKAKERWNFSTRMQFMQQLGIL